VSVNLRNDTFVNSALKILTKNKILETWEESLQTKNKPNRS
jgi:hypothetical protein